MYHFMQTVSLLRVFLNFFFTKIILFFLVYVFFLFKTINLIKTIIPFNIEIDINNTRDEEPKNSGTKIAIRI